MNADDCKAAASRYRLMAWRGDSITEIIAWDSAQRWEFYARIARRLGRALTFQEQDRLYETCWTNNFKIGYIPG